LSDDPPSQSHQPEIIAIVRGITTAQYIQNLLEKPQPSFSAKEKKVVLNSPWGG
jgi:hypothetical protein